jgi:hypothetical protein
MRKSLNAFEVAAAKAQLRAVRQRSLAASRQGDYRTVAKLTCEAAELKRLILEAAGLFEVAA